MEENSSKTSESERKEESENWRVEFTPDARQKFVANILGLMKSRVPNLGPDALPRMTRVAEQLEDKIYCNATTKSNYVSMMSKKMSQIGKSFNPTVAASSSSSVSVGQGMQTNNLTNSKREVLASQASKKVVPQVKVSTLPVQVNINNGKQGHHIESKTSQIQGSPGPALATESHHQELKGQSNASNFHRNQFLAEENNLEQHLQSLRGKSMLNLSKQTERVKYNSSGLQQPPRKDDPQTNFVNLLSAQHSSQISEQVENTSSEQKLLHAATPIQVHQSLVSQKQSKQDDKQQRSEAIATSHQSQNVTEQQQQLILVKIIAKARQEFAALSELKDMVEWYNRAYQQIRSLREHFLPWLKVVYEKMCAACQKLSNPEVVEKQKAKIVGVRSMIKLLLLSRSDFECCPKTKLEGHMRSVIQFLNVFQQNNSISVHQHVQQIQPTREQSQSSQLQQHGHERFPSHQFNLASASSSVVSLSLTQHGNMSSQQNIISSLQSDSQKRLEQRINLSQSNEIVRQTAVLTKGNSRTSQAVISSGQQNSSFQQLQQNKEQLKHRTMRSENLKQHSKSQLQQTPVHDVQSVASSNLLQLDTLQGRPPDHPHKKLLPATSDQPHTFSPQVSEHASFENKHVSSPLSKLIVAQNQSLALSRKSSPQAELTDPHGNQQSSATTESLERLLKAVESISPEALCASSYEISSVMNTGDMAVGNLYNEYKANIGEDLSSATMCDAQAMSYSSQNRSLLLKRKLSAVTKDMLSSLSSEADNLKQSFGQMCDYEIPATSFKRCKVEAEDALLNEIKNINRQLLETKINLDSNESSVSSIVSNGRTVRFVYGAMAVDENLKASPMLPVLHLRLRVPANYPISSPVILDGLPVDYSCDNRESLDLSEKAKSRFSTSLRKLSEPMSLEEMAKAWDICARSVFRDFFSLLGGECFSSRYGMWENFITAS